MLIRPLDSSVIKNLRSDVAFSCVSQCVEELVWNSIDAGANCVAVRLNLSFFKIQVVDNGHGIPKDQLEEVGKRYSTSKCHTIDDLQNLQYAGFRGEALSSLKEVSSNLMIESQASGSSKTYCKIFSNGKSDGVSISINSRPSKGTTVTVFDFMYNRPVRKNNISEALDMEETRKLLLSIALMHPSISFSLQSEASGEMCLQFKKCSSSFFAFVQLFGKEKAKNLKEVKQEIEGYQIIGYINTDSFPTKDCQFLFVNKRLVLKTKLNKLINSLLYKYVCSNLRSKVRLFNSPLLDSPSRNQAQHASFILNISCPRDKCDVIFDRKRSMIEFSEWDKVFKLVEDAVLGFLRNEKFLFESPKNCEQACAEEIPAEKNACFPNLGIDNFKYGLFSHKVKRLGTLKSEAQTESNVVDGHASEISISKDLCNVSNVNDLPLSRNTCEISKESNFQSLPTKEANHSNLNSKNGIICLKDSSKEVSAFGKLKEMNECNRKESFRDNHFKIPAPVSLNSKLDIPCRSVFPMNCPVMLKAPVKSTMSLLEEKGARSKALLELSKKYLYVPKGHKSSKVSLNQEKKSTKQGILNEQQHPKPNSSNCSNKISCDEVKTKDFESADKNDSKITSKYIFSKEFHSPLKRFCRSSKKDNSSPSNNRKTSIKVVETNFLETFLVPNTHNSDTVQDINSNEVKVSKDFGTESLNSPYLKDVHYLLGFQSKRNKNYSEKTSTKKGFDNFLNPFQCYESKGDSIGNNQKMSYSKGKLSGQNKVSSSTTGVDEQIILSESAEETHFNLPADSATFLGKILSSESPTLNKNTNFMYERKQDVNVSNRDKSLVSPLVSRVQNLEILSDLSPKNTPLRVKNDDEEKNEASSPKHLLSQETSTFCFRPVSMSPDKSSHCSTIYESSIFKAISHNVLDQPQSRKMNCELKDSSQNCPSNALLVSNIEDALLSNEIILLHESNSLLNDDIVSEQLMEEASQRKSSSSIAKVNSFLQYMTCPSTKQAIYSSCSDTNTSSTHSFEFHESSCMGTSPSSLHCGTTIPSTNENVAESSKHIGLHSSTSFRSEEGLKTISEAISKQPWDTTNLEVVNESADVISSEGPPTKEFSVNENSGIMQNSQVSPVGNKKTASNLIPLPDVEKPDENRWICETNEETKTIMYIDSVTGNSTYHLPEAFNASKTKHNMNLIMDPKKKTHFFLSHDFSPFLSDERQPAIDVVGENCNLKSNLNKHIELQENKDWQRKWREPLNEANPDGDIEEMFNKWENPMFDVIFKELYDGDSKTSLNLPPICLLNSYRFTKQSLESLKVIGQVDCKFIACIIQDFGEDHHSNSRLLALFDQHAVHERIRLEDLTEDLYETLEFGKRVIKTIPVPQELTAELEPENIRLLRSYHLKLQDLGIHLSIEDDDNVLVSSIPSCFFDKSSGQLRKKAEDIVIIIQKIIKEWLNSLTETRAVTRVLPKALCSVLNSQACRGAVKFGDPLSLSQCEELMQSLSRCKLPFQCAHGRPSIAPILDLGKIDTLGKKESKPQLKNLVKAVKEDVR